MPESYPLSPLQQAMLLHSLVTPGAGLYIQQIVGRLREDLNVPAFRRAWQLLTERHPILRTSFHLDGDAPRQAVHDEAACPWEEQNLQGVTPADQQQRIDAFLQSDRQRGFDPERAPLMRLTLFHLGPNDFVLVWSNHHCILDGRSRLLLIREAFAVYDELVQGHAPNLPLPRPYRDFIDWLRDQDDPKREAFWRKSLQGFRDPTPLLAPSAFRPAAAAGPGPGECTAVVSAEVTARLQEIGKPHGWTLNTFFQAAWALLLARYSGEEDVVFGSTRACRRSALDGAESMVGVFINTLPFRVRVPADMELTPWLHEVRIRNLAQIPFEHTPLAQVQEYAGIKPSTPLFESLAVFENYQLTETLRRQGGAWQQREFRLIQKTNYPLVLTGYGGNEIILQLLYDETRYDRATIERMLAHLSNMLGSMANNLQQRLRDIDMLGAAERQQIVETWNATQTPFADGKTIHQLTEEQVERTPDAVAVIFENTQLTYRQLNARANQVAHHLRQRGVGPGVLVDFFMVRSADMLVAMLGILKAGGAYVPLDTNFPKDRLAFLLQDTKAHLVLTQEALLDKLPEHGVPTICIDRDWPAIAQESDANPPPLAKPEDTCYIIFTSGSTGIPKGVVLQHRAVVNTLDWVNKTFRMGPGDRLLFVTSQCFDLSVYDIFGTFANGGTIRVASAADLKDPERLLKLLCDDGITIWDSAPPQLQQLVPFLPQLGERAKQSKLRLVMLSGDWIPVPMPDQVRGVFPKAEMVSLGGATEAAIWSNYYRIGAVDPKWPSIPYGVPMQNCRYHILDARLQPVPVGVAAELHIGGTCLAAGYLNRTELTAERFIADPFHPSERLYKTGDLARYLPDGNIEFLGRIDFQVKVRGYRIELGEIEAALNQHPAVRESVVSARADATGVKVLIAYCIPKPGQSIDRNELKTFLLARLPDYMVPAHFVSLDAFPLNANGKLDRKALPAPETGAGGSQRVIVPPRYDVERDLLAIWEDVLKVKPIGVTDNFFELGGHSLQAATLAARVKSQLGPAIPLGLIFSAPTVEQMAAHLRGNLEFGTGGCLVPLTQRGGWPPLFLVSGIGGHVFIFHKFARLLGPEQPCFGVKAVGVDGAVKPPDSIEETAAVYVKEILTQRPEGPILLGGYSVGALAAFETAVQLQARGKKVDMLLILDTNAPGYPRPLPVWQRALLHAKNFAKLPMAEKTTYVKARWNNVMARALHKAGLGAALAPEVVGDKPAERTTFIGRVKQAMQANEASAADQELVLKRVWAALRAAQRNYRPTSKFAGKITLFKCEHQDEWAATVFDDPLKGWRQYTTVGVEDHTFPGDHLALLEDEKNMSRMAEKLTEIIRRSTTPAAKIEPPTPAAVGTAS